MEGMFLKAMSNFTERVGTRFTEDPKTGAQKIYKLGKVKKVGTGHIFWHPDKERALRLIAMGKGKGGVPIVEAVNDVEMLKYIKDAITGKRDPQTKEVIREPIALSSLEPEVQAWWKKHAKKADKAAAEPGADETPPEEEPTGPGPAAGDVDEDPDADVEDEGEGEPKPKGKGGKKGRK